MGELIGELRELLDTANGQASNFKDGMDPNDAISYAGRIEDLLSDALEVCGEIIDAASAGE